MGDRARAPDLVARTGRSRVILTVITVVEVWVYYIPASSPRAAFVPSLLIMSAVKFVIVVMFYMHLRYDHKLFRALFTGPLIIAVTTIIALLFLFGKISRAGGRARPDAIRRCRAAAASRRRALALDRVHGALRAP